MSGDTAAPDAVIRLLPERHLGEQGSPPRFLPERFPDAARTCARCLQPVSRAEYDAFDFYCMVCDEAATTFPWQTTAGGIAP